ncbi:MAG: ArnT family glycosyltransferase [Myxococcota bacterium]
MHVLRLILGFSAASILIRFPFFFRDVIDWDESTFILVGQAWLDGHLPYVTLWDNKPPLLFAVYAGILAGFGKTIAAVRLAGALMVGMTATACSLTAARLGRAEEGEGSPGHVADPTSARKSERASTWAGLGAGSACVVLLTVGSGGLATMSETVAVVPLMAAVALLVHGPRHATGWMLVGLLLSVAALIRLNLAIPAVSAWLLSYLDTTRRRMLAIASGASVPIAGLGLLYGLSGHLSLLWSSVVLAPFRYATVPLYLSATATTGRLSFQGRWKPSVWLSAMGLATLLSILATGERWSHYWLQVHPFLAVLLGLVLGGLVTGRIHLLEGTVSLGVPRWVRVVGVAGLLGLGGFGVLRLGHHYGALVSAWDADREARRASRLDLGWSYGTAVEVARLLDRHDPTHPPMFLATAHLAYWFLDQRPLTRMSTHPSNLLRAHLLRTVEGEDADAVSELRRILDQKPSFIVVERDLGRFQKDAAAEALLGGELERSYRLLGTVEHIGVFRRIPRVGPL